MRRKDSRLLTAAAVAVLLAGAGAAPDEALAQKRIVCWKDKAGKIIGCGDTVPPEYRDSGVSELDRRGVTRATRESVEEEARRRAEEKERAARRAEEQKSLAERRRQDSTLLATYSSAEEIDQKRDRELQQIDLQITQLNVSLKNAAARYDEVKARQDTAGKAKKPAPAGTEEELARIGAERQRLAQSIAAKQKEKEELHERYAEQKRRYLELKGAPARSADRAADAPAAKK
jgi:chromosome segregation ATPase